MNGKDFGVRWLGRAMCLRGSTRPITSFQIAEQACPASPQKSGVELPHSTLLVGWLLLMLLSATHLRAQDVFDTKKQVPVSPGEPLLKGAVAPTGPVTGPLELTEAIDRALSNNPKTREQWANIKVQAAAVGSAYSTYLPTLSGSLQGTRQNSSTSVKEAPALGSDFWANTNTESASLSWLLYDFGGREASVANAKSLLMVARASHEATLREVFADVTKDYYAAQAAQGSLKTACENAQTAQQSYEVATQRVQQGVSPVSDSLQAQTASVQAQVYVTKAEGDAQIAIGTLAVDLGMRPDVVLTLPEVETGVKPDESFQESVSTLIDQAIKQHPDVRLAEEQLNAAVAKVKEVRAKNYPTLSIVGKTSRSEQPLNAEVGVSPFQATQKDSYLGLQLDVPIFDGFNRSYQIRQAEAQVEAQRYALEVATQKAGLDVWTTYQTMEQAAKNLQTTATLVEITEKSYDAAQGRYESGVGSMIERLNAQSSLANAKLQWIKALIDWRSSRLQLASKLGEMGQLQNYAR